MRSETQLTLLEAADTCANNENENASVRYFRGIFKTDNLEGKGSILQTPCSHPELFNSTHTGRKRLSLTVYQDPLLQEPHEGPPHCMVG